MTIEQLLPSEEVIETCSILTILSPIDAPKIIGGHEIRMAFQNYKADKIEKYLSYINRISAISITTLGRSSDLKLPNIKTVEINYDRMNLVMKILASQMHDEITKP